MFWPDLATSHYQKDVQKWFSDNNITIVSKLDNAPNCPQARPIERFWSICKMNYKKLKKAPDTMRKFENQWRKISKKVEKDNAQALMRSIRRKLRSIAEQGVFSVK